MLRRVERIRSDDSSKALQGMKISYFDRKMIIDRAFALHYGTSKKKIYIFQNQTNSSQKYVSSDRRITFSNRE